MERISEKLIVDCLPLNITSATTSISPGVSIKGMQTVAFVVSIATASVPTRVDVTGYQGNSTAPNTTAITGATAHIGSTVANTLAGAARALIYLSTATTDAETLVINGTTFTYNSTGSATNLAFGATAGASAAAGVAIAALSSLINTYCTNLTATTGTSWVDVVVKDGASTNINITSTGGGLTPAYVRAECILEIQTVGLNATCDYVCCQVTSASTAVAGAIVTIRDADVKPARAHGQIVNDVNT